MDTLVAFGHFGDLHHPKVSKMLTTKVSKALNIFLIQESRVTCHHIQLLAYPVTLPISQATVVQFNFEKLFSWTIWGFLDTWGTTDVVVLLHTLFKVGQN